MTSHETCHHCWRPAIGQAWNHTEEEWHLLCAECVEKKNPDMWQQYNKEEKENEG